jgi:predicted Zn-dependent protease
LLLGVLFLLGGSNRIARGAPSQPVLPDLPPLQVHPLPPYLAAWQSSVGDYFDQVEPIQIRDQSIGYLIWSQFPIRVYVQPIESLTQQRSLDLSSKPTQSRSQSLSKNELGNELSRSSQLKNYQSQTRSRDQIWWNAVQQALQEWHQYLPLTQVTSAAEADIEIMRSSIPIRRAPGSLELPRIRMAETQYQWLIQAGNFSHRCRITLRPGQAPLTLLAAARHELGHALGIWGHSPVPTDTLYFAQVRNPPSISDRDVNTLKRIYQQPTRFGFPIPARKSA